MSMFCNTRINSEGGKLSALTPKRKKKTKIADNVFEENYLTISWPNFSEIGSGAADLELKTYA